MDEAKLACLLGRFVVPVDLLNEFELLEEPVEDHDPTLLAAVG